MRVMILRLTLIKTCVRIMIANDRRLGDSASLKGDTMQFICATEK